MQNIKTIYTIEINKKSNNCTQVWKRFLKISKNTKNSLA